MKILATETYESERKAVEKIKGAKQRMLAELSKVIIGQEDVIEHLFIAVLSGGHCLLTGAPGLAKTLLVISFKISANPVYAGFNAG
jgi:MoxR-like ATPase